MALHVPQRANVGQPHAFGASLLLLCFAFAAAAAERCHLLAALPSCMLQGMVQGNGYFALVSRFLGWHVETSRPASVVSLVCSGNALYIHMYMQRATSLKKCLTTSKFSPEVIQRAYRGTHCSSAGLRFG